MRSAVPASKAVMLPKPILPTNQQSQFESQVSSQPADRRSNVSQPISRPSSLQERTIKAGTSEIDAILEHYHLRCNRELQNIFHELKTKLLQRNQENSQNER